MFPRLGRSEGQAAAEFVITLPLLLAMIWALAQFGILFAHWIVLTRAVSAGARAAAVCRFGTGPDPATVVANDSQGLVSSGQVTVTACPTSGNQVTVSVNNNPCQSFDIWFVGSLGSICLNASSTEREE